MDTKLRSVRRDEAATLCDIYRPYVEHTAISFETECPSVAEFAARIEKISSKYPWLVCESQGQVVGYAYASQHRERAAYRWSVDVAIYLEQQFHGCGIGSLLYRRLLSEVKELGYLNALAGIALPNEKSIGLHRSMGFKHIGIYQSVGYKLGKWHDVSWWQLRLGDYPPTPAEPRNFNRENLE